MLIDTRIKRIQQILTDYMRKIKIKVLPRSSKNEIVGELPDGTIKIKLKAPPIDGEANTELIKFLSKEWKVSKSSIRILKGKTSKTKLVEID